MRKFLIFKISDAKTSDSASLKATRGWFGYGLIVFICD